MTLANHIKNMINTPSDSQLLSIRLQATTVNQLEELAQALNKTRTDLITTFIDGGLVELEKQLIEHKQNEYFPDKDKSSESRYFLLNTNYNNSESDHYNMLENEEASAFYDNRKENITYLRKDDVVFLYQSGVGVVGYGKADGELVKREHEGSPNAWYSQKLLDFVRLESPLTAKGCKDITKSNFNFRMTMVSLTNKQGDLLVGDISQR